MKKAIVIEIVGRIIRYMNKTRISLLGVFLTSVLLLSACTQPETAAPVVSNPAPVIQNPPKMVLVTDSQAASFKEIGCSDKLTLVSLKGDTLDLKTALTTLLSTKDASVYGAGLSTASALSDGYFSFASAQKSLIKNVETYVVELKSNPSVGLTGACDTPRFKNQIIETVKANAAGTPFVIKLDTSEKKWNCLGDESGEC